MNKNNILDVLKRVLNGEETFPEEHLQIFSDALEAKSLRQEIKTVYEDLNKAQAAFNELQQHYSQLKQDWEDSILKTLEIGKLINELEEKQAKFVGFHEFMSNLTVETLFGESKVKDVAEALWKGKELGPQPVETDASEAERKDNNPDGGCCGGNCGCH